MAQDEWSAEDITKIMTNPIYCLGGQPIVSQERWIAAGSRLIKEIGAEAYLQRVLANVQGLMDLASGAGSDEPSTGSGKWIVETAMDFADEKDASAFAETAKTWLQEKIHLPVSEDPDSYPHTLVAWREEDSEGGTVDALFPTT